MSDNLKKTADVYFNLFSIMTRFNHKIWRTIPLPLPANHFIVMCILYNDNTSLTNTELAQNLSVSKQQMSSIVDRLLKKRIGRKKISNTR